MTSGGVARGMASELAEKVATADEIRDVRPDEAVKGYREVIFGKGGVQVEHNSLTPRVESA